MITIGFGSIGLDGHHVSGLRYSLDDARIAAMLQATGASVKLYAGKAEGRVSDLARQLVRMRRDVCVLHITPHTLAPTVEVARALISLVPEMRVLFWGAGDGVPSAALARMEALGPWLRLAQPAQVAAALADRLGLSTPPAASPYSTGLLTAHDALRVGLTCLQAPQLYRDEFAWLAQQDLASDAVLPCTAHGAGALLPHWCVALGAAGGQYRVALALDAADCTDALFAALPPARIARLEVAGARADMPASASAWSARIVTAEDGAARRLKSSQYGRNGNLVMHTGFYFDAKQAPGIYHLEVPLALDAAARTRVYEWAAASMDIRSAAVLQGALDLVIDPLSGAGPSAHETGGWPKHVYALAHDPADGTAELTLDGAAGAQRLRYIALSELATARAQAGETRMLQIRSALDADVLERHLAAFHDEGRIVMVQPHIALFVENACRWTSFGGCRLPLLRRLQAAPDLSLSACRDAGVVGRVGDSYDHIVLRVKQQQQLDEVRRDCAGCELRDNCSRCAQLPDEWGGRYCELRRRYPHAALYFELLTVAHTLAGYVDAADELELRISYRNLPAQHYLGRPGAAPEGARPLLITMGGQCFAWWRGTRRIVKLSAPLAMMAEAWWHGADADDAVAALCDAFRVDSAKAENSLAQGWAKLRAQEVIHA